MGAFLSYSIVSGVILMAMYLAFRLMLSAEKQPAYNRGVILAMYAVAFLAIPVISWIKSLVPASAADAVMVVTTTEVVDTVTEAVADTPVWGTVLIWVYIAGMATVMIATIATWARILRVIASGEKTAADGYTLVLTDDNGISPFSWMRYVVMSRRDYELCGAAITAHELRHIRACHWADLLVAQAVVVINWFNPAAWFTREELMLIHEYQADMAVLEAGHDARQYQMLLIEKAVGARFPSLANSLNHSKLKKRITMMYQNSSGRGRRFKALALVPAAALALSLVAIPSVSAAISTIENSVTVIGGKDSNNSADVQAGKPSLSVTLITNARNRTVIEVVAYNNGPSVSITDGTFTTVGKTYKAQNTNVDVSGDMAVIMFSFPFLTEFDNTSRLSFCINGEPKTIELYKLLGLQKPDDAELKAEPAPAEARKSVQVNKEFYGSRFTGDWINPCSGETKEKLASIFVSFTPVEGGYDVIALMYDKNGSPVKVGRKFCKGEPKPDFARYPLKGLETVDLDKYFSTPGNPMPRDAAKAAGSVSSAPTAPGENTTSVTITIDGDVAHIKRPGEGRQTDVKIDRSKSEDGYIYLYDDRQITKKELDAIAPSTIRTIDVARSEGLKVVYVMQR